MPGIDGKSLTELLGMAETTGSAHARRVAAFVRNAQVRQFAAHLREVGVDGF